MLLFTKEPGEYGRDLDMVKHYVNDAAFYLSKKTGRSIEECAAVVKREIGPGGKFEMKDPRVMYLAKETEGNREMYFSTMSEYLRVVAERNCIMAATMAVYFNPNEKRSMLADYILGNLKKRKDVKKKMFECDMAGDKEGESFYNILQTTYKVKNNSLSGAHASASTPLYNKSSHSTLTSLCRSASGTANASNERFLSGNRHYYTLDITLANIVSIVNNTDMALVSAAVNEFNLHCPTPTEVCALIKRSTDFYWRSPDKFKKVEELVATLTDLERAAFAYMGDFWHLKEFNPEFMRAMIKDLIYKEPVEVEDPKAVIKELDADQFALVGLYCGKILNGSTIGDVMKEGGERLRLIGGIARRVMDAIARYRSIYAAFMVTDNVPASLADFPTSVRRTAIVSDTDSTIFTVQDWTEWYRGQIDFSEESTDIATIIVYFGSQLVKHYLAVVSGNMGIVREKIHTVSMKNEYMFPVFALTPRAKHYYACMSAREGNVFLEHKLEVKGVTLKNSKVPDDIMSGANQLIVDIMDTIKRGEQIDLQQILKDVADKERMIRDSILSGEVRFLTTAQVKAPEFYTKPESSPYAHYLLWQDVFADKYGQSDPPPFFAIKASLRTDNKTKFKEWMDSLEDRALADRLAAWAERNGKDKMTTIMLPASIVGSSGVPIEIAQAIDIRKITYNTMEAYYLILESLGYYINVDDSISNLVSDRH